MSKVVKLVILWIVFLLATVFLSAHKTSLDFFLSWDSGHFIGIAENGYKYNFQYAFFPLFPIIIFFASKLFFITVVCAAVLINFSAFSLAIFLLYKLLTLDYSAKFSLKVVLVILTFPLSFFFILPYSESLFFLLSVASFYFAAKSKFKLAYLLAGLSLLTRPLGMATIVAVFIEIFIVQRKKTKAFFLLPIFFIIYSFYLKFRKGDFFYYLKAQEHWQRSLALPVDAFWQNLKIISSQTLNYQTVPVLAEIIALVLATYLLIKSYQKLRISFFIYFLISLLLPLLTGKLTSLPRFLIVIFPLFITLALLLKGRLFKFYLLVSIICLWFSVGMFVNGYWVS